MNFASFKLLLEFGSIGGHAVHDPAGVFRITLGADYDAHNDTI